MKRNGLRALGLASCVVALFSLLSVAVDLNTIVANELIDEINLAAGLNLVDEYIANYTVEELEDLAVKGLTPGIKLAADRALFKLNGGLEPFIAMEDEDLLAKAIDGDMDAAEAYVFNTRVGLTKPQAVLDAIATAESVALEYAYGKVLGGFYGPGSPVGEKTEAELLELVASGSYGERIAAATALTTYWILNSDLDHVDVEREILAHTQTELGLAYQGFLTYLYSL